MKPTTNRTLTLLTLAFAFVAQVLNAQTLEQYIPKDAVVVAGINSKNILSKFDEAALKDLGWVQEMEANIKGSPDNSWFTSIFFTAEDYGLNVNPSTYFYYTLNDTFSHWGYLVEVKDKTKLEATMKDAFGIDAAERGVQEPQYSAVMDGNSGIAWNDKVAFVYGYDVNFYAMDGYSFKWGEETTWKDEQEHQEKIETELTKTFLKNTFTRGASASIKSVPSYVAHDKSGDVWVHASAIGLFTSLEKERVKLMNELQVEENSAFMKRIDQQKKTYANLALSLETGKVGLELTTGGAPELMKSTQAVYDHKINKNFFKYIPAEGLLGFQSIAVSPEGYGEFWENEVLPFYEGIPEFGPLVTNGLQIATTLLDEEEIYDLLRGDEMIAITGFKEIEYSYTNYTYDDDFNMKEVVETRKETLPTFIGLASIGNEYIVSRLIKMAEGAKGIRAKGGYYQVTVDDLQLPVFFFWKDDILFYSNDEAWIQTSMNGGYAKSDQVDKSIKKLMTKNPVVVYWDMEETAKMVKEQGFLRSKDELAMLDIAIDEASFMQLNGPTFSGSEAKVELVLDIKDKNVNVIEYVFRLIEEFYQVAKQSNGY